MMIDRYKYHYLLIYISLLLGIFLLSACQPKGKSYGSRHIQVFKEEPVRFSDSLYANDSSIVQLAQGRILLKKITVPQYEKHTTVSIKLRVQSNGDSWDKSGSVFLLDADMPINLLNLSDSIQLPIYPHLDYAGVLCADNYSPMLELMRFMTPFGVGFYSDKVRRKPVYIPHYENEVLWVQDISDRLSALQGDVWVGIWIDTWTAEGYKVDLSLEFEETKAVDYPKIASYIAPLVNTVAYVSGQDLPDFFAHQDLETHFNVPQNAKNVQLKYIVTGHGGHSGGDEFTKQENKIYVDDKELLSFVPWRDDCASFRRFNPSSGVWLVKDTASYIDEDLGRYNEKVIEERIASSDLSRSNWCPGSDVQPVSIPLHNIKAGEHSLKISIPNAQAADDVKLNHWLLSVYLYWEL